MKVIVEVRTQLILPPHQVYTHRQLATGEDSTPDLRIWGLVRTHCVESNVRQHRDRMQLLRFLDFEYFAPFVRPALRAGTMRQLALVAVRALAQANRGKSIVRTALGGTGLGMAPLWD